jgi:hypothetical protein
VVFVFFFRSTRILPQLRIFFCRVFLQIQLIYFHPTKKVFFRTNITSGDRFQSMKWKSTLGISNICDGWRQTFGFSKIIINTVLTIVWESAREPYGKRRFSWSSQKSNFRRNATIFFYVDIGVWIKLFLDFSSNGKSMFLDEPKVCVRIVFACYSPFSPPPFPHTWIYHRLIITPFLLFLFLTE